MSKQAQQRTRLALYQELSEIVSAMKNMAEVELHRTTRIERNQEQALATALEGMTLLLQAAPQLTAPTPLLQTVLIVLGSERGFCGGFNEQLVRALKDAHQPGEAVLVVGGRLAGKLGALESLTVFPGPATADEVLPCVQQLVEHLLSLPMPLGLRVLGHGPHALEHKLLLPCPKVADIAPVVHVDLPSAPGLLFEELQWQCVHQGLLRAMLVSLQRENRMRLQQMEGAREHLDELIDTLRLRLNTLRQQEIVEEIETILVDQHDRYGSG